MDISPTVHGYILFWGSEMKTANAFWSMTRKLSTPICDNPWPSDWYMDLEPLLKQWSYETKWHLVWFCSMSWVIVLSFMRVVSICLMLWCRSVRQGSNMLDQTTWHPGRHFSIDSMTFAVLSMNLSLSRFMRSFVPRWTAIMDGLIPGFFRHFLR